MNLLEKANKIGDMARVIQLDERDLRLIKRERYIVSPSGGRTINAKEVVEATVEAMEKHIAEQKLELEKLLVGERDELLTKMEEILVEKGRIERVDVDSDVDDV